MLKIFMGEMSDDRVLYNVDVYFNNQMNPEWLKTDLAKEIIKDIDKSELVSPFNVISPVFGSISTTKISGGSKALLLMMFQDSRIIDATNCGDNCAKWILKIAEEKEKEGKDLIINLHYLMDFGDESFNAVLLNNNIEIHCMRDFVYYGAELLI